MDVVRGGASPPACCQCLVMNAWDWPSRVSRLSCAERDDAANRIVWRNADGDAITGDDFDAEAAHPAAQLREDFMSGIALDAIQPARVDSDDDALHVDKIIFAQ